MAIQESDKMYETFNKLIRQRSQRESETLQQIDTCKTTLQQTTHYEETQVKQD